MKKILFVVGTRPEAIKLCPLYLKAKKRKDVTSVLLSTGQHTDMLSEHLSGLGVSADASITLKKSAEGLGYTGAALLEELYRFIEKQRPHATVVQGDTSSAFFGALASFYAGVTVVHVEAGLRSHNPLSPFPEEAHRKMIAALANIHIAPSEQARQNLTAERVHGKIFVLGNTVTDTLSLTLDEGYRNFLTDKEYILVTAHRRESGMAELSEMMSAIRKISLAHKELSIIFPVHPSPRVRTVAEKQLKNAEGVILIPPLSLYDFHNLEYRARLVLTDSGGVQEECAAMGIPILVMRDNTEREAELSCGKLLLCGRTEQGIISACEKLLLAPKPQRSVPKTSVCEKILDVLLCEL